MDGEVYSQSTCIASRAAHLYYVDGLPQSKISRELGVSVPTVSRLIRRARDEGLVQFSIREPYASCLEFEKDLRSAYGLSEVLVVPTVSGPDPEASKKAVALEAARLVQRLTTAADVLGIAWGGTMYYLIQYLNPCRRIPASFVTMHGSISCCGEELDVRNLVGRMAMAFGGRRYALEAAGLQDSAHEVALLADTDRERHVHNLYDRISISVCGVGSFHPNQDSLLANSTYLDSSAKAELLAAGAYGDLALRFFDADGAECKTSLAERTVAISLDQYRRIPRKVVAASGVQKAETVRALLRGGLADLLIIDHALAEAVLTHRS
jgi:deoxyribonucleoside regulator